MWCCLNRVSAKSSGDRIDEKLEIRKIDVGRCLSAHGTRSYDAGEAPVLAVPIAIGLAVPDTSLNQLCNDLAEAARLAGVPFDRHITQRVISVFAEGFRRSPVELRTTDKPLTKRGLSYRFVELDTPMAPFQVGRETGLLPQSDRPVDRLIPEIGERFVIE